MNSFVTQAAIHFGCDVLSVESLTEGLIHQTFKVNSKDGDSIILQQINTTVFRNPELVNENYRTISQHLKAHSSLRIPSLIKTSDLETLWRDESGMCWRAFEYIQNSYSETQASSARVVYHAARCYGEFVHALFDLDASTILPTIPGFHDLALRYHQLGHAISNGNPERIKECKDLLGTIERFKTLFHFYNKMVQSPEFKMRTMHHDCKLSNVLFEKGSGEAICPIDLDTVMPGYFFSDVGDMVRSMVSSADENSPAENVDVRKDIYLAIISGYQSGIQDSFTEAENRHLHHAGMIMIYMQGIRFLTDYLQNDAYYRISYPKQNFNRADNQLQLLKKLDQFLKEEYHYQIG